VKILLGGCLTCDELVGVTQKVMLWYWSWTY